MANVIVKLPPRTACASGHATTDLVACGPHHLGVVSNCLQIRYRCSICKVFVFKKPTFNGKEPEVDKISCYDHTLKTCLIYTCI